MLAAATLFEANSLPEFDVLNHFHYLNMHSRIFSSVLLTEMFDLRAEAQPALHFGGGGIFMKFHSMTSSCLFDRGTTFRKRSRINSLRSISENENFSVLSRYRPNDQDRVKIGSLIQTPGFVLNYCSHGFGVPDV